MTDLTFINYTILIIGLAISLSGLLLMLAIRFLAHWYKSFFVTLFTIMLVYLGFNLICILSMAAAKPEDYYLSKISMYIYSIASSLPTLMLSYLIINVNSKTHIKGTMLTRLSTFIWIVYVALLSITQFTSFIYYFTPDNVYHRGDFYYLLLVPPALMMVINFVGVIMRWKTITPRQRRAFSIYLIIPLIGTLIQMFFFGIVTIALCASIASLYMFIFSLEDHVDNAMDTLKTNADQKASILALQMRPHFIYNTLTSIYYLCDEDTEKAKSTILAFTSYMRKNFTVLSSEDTIPFADELEHAKAYLEVEKTRFDDDIDVEYDIAYTDFKLPPLTLQPLAENAVKHGRKPDGGILNIIIRTVQTKTGVDVIVENTGAAFGEIKNDDPHIALNNMRERLKMMCNGTLSITSVPETETEEAKTIATISLPKV